MTALDDTCPPVPGEIYRDPIYDGATDPTAVQRGDGDWWMFYTQRRATHPDPGPGVAWVHGSRIGIARSTDGLAWRYEGVLTPSGSPVTEGAGAGALRLDLGQPPAIVDRTQWAPDVVRVGGHWRMYLTEITGVPDAWEGHARHIVEYRSDDLVDWERVGTVPLESDRVIDAALAHCPDGLWRLWYKDEAAQSVTKVACSADLESWSMQGIAIGGRAHEGPYVFALGGWWWMLTDEWRGMAVYRSRDAVSWHRQGDEHEVILGERDAARVEVGRHGSVVVRGDHAWLYFFTHPWWNGIDDTTTVTSRRSVVHRAVLRVVDGALVCDRDRDR